jgi:hypothetical protein
MLKEFEWTVRPRKSTQIRPSLMADSLAMNLIMTEWALQLCKIRELDRSDPGGHRVGIEKDNSIDA